MIISDKFKFVFVHIPKCAGTSVRQLLAQFDDTGERYRPHVMEHRSYGKIDFTHLPLPLLLDIAPDDFEKLRAYEAFAIVRDPRERFFSALAQRLKMYEKRELAQMQSAEVIESALRVIDALHQPSNRFAYNFIHFTPQVDFINLNGERLVQNIYPITDVASLVTHLEDLTGSQLDFVGKKNPTTVFRSGSMKAVVLTGKRVVETILPPSLSDPIRRLARRKLMKPIQHLEHSYSFHPEISLFISSYYAEDQKIFSKALPRKPKNNGLV